MSGNIGAGVIPKSKHGRGSGFSSKKKSFGYVPNSTRGNFSFPLPKISNKAFSIEHSKRMALLADFSVTEREAAAQFGVDRASMHKYRVWLKKLASEKPTLANMLFREPLRTQLIAREYYEKGPNWLRLNYELTNVATRGLLLWLKAAGFIDKVSTATKH